MTEIHVIDLIDTTHEGPAAMGTKGEEQQVHLHQGSLDGACGPYCLLMSLLICGLADRTSGLSSPYSKKTSIGKVLERIHRGVRDFLEMELIWKNYRILLMGHLLKG